MSRTSRSGYFRSYSIVAPQAARYCSENKKLSRKERVRPLSFPSFDLAQDKNGELVEPCGPKVAPFQNTFWRLPAGHRVGTRAPIKFLFWWGSRRALDNSYEVVFPIISNRKESRKRFSTT